MAEPEQCILIIQPDDFQHLVWETVLLSQKLTVSVESSGCSPIKGLKTRNAQGETFVLALVDWRAVRDIWAEWSELCTQQTPPLKTVLLLPKNITPIERQAAENTDAVETVYWVDKGNIIASVIAGTRRILDQLDDVMMDREALVSSLVTFKRLVDDTDQQPGAGPKRSRGGKELQGRDRKPKPQAPEQDPSSRPGDPDNRKRRYRGQTY